MSVSIEEMRAAVCKQYGNSPKWVAKVGRMSDSQIIAIYLRLQKGA